MLKKKIVHTFGKHYLLGQYKSGIYFYLNAPSWYCSRYWGFGYIITYENNTYPEYSRDISSYSHYSGLMGKRAHILNDNPEVKETVLTEGEQWTLSELIDTAYKLRETAEILGRGWSHITSNPCKDIIRNKAEVKRINEVVLPEIFKKIEELLTSYIEI